MLPEGQGHTKYFSITITILQKLVETTREMMVIDNIQW
jgi:hypothetical protein